MYSRYTLTGAQHDFVLISGVPELQASYIILCFEKEMLACIAA